MSIREVNRVLSEYFKQKIDPKSSAALRWLSTNLQKITTEVRPQNFNQTKSSGQNASMFLEGCMMFFGYEPKGKNDLPFWDEYPLVILLEKQGTSFLGLNLHYLRPSERAAFLEYLLKFVDNPDYHKSPPSYINVTYQQLKRSRYMKKCIKKYLLENIKTKVNVIPSTDWKIVSFLPIDKFKGASREEVWE